MHCVVTMKSISLFAAIALTGCQFGIAALEPPKNLGDGSTAHDLGTVPDTDLATSDDLSPAPDLMTDPCGLPLAPASDTVTAACTIGDMPAIDGNLNDWAPSLFTLSVRHQTAASSFGSWHNDEHDNDDDLSARGALRWDQSYLYLAFQITDDARSTNSIAFWDNDTIELYLDGLGDRADDYGSDDLEIMVRADGEVRFYRDGGEVKPAQTITVKVSDRALDKGWNLELAVPWSALGNGAVVPARRLGFTLQLNDNDNGALRDRGMIWQNKVSGGCNTCVGSCAPWCNTKSFYDLRLGSRP